MLTTTGIGNKDVSIPVKEILAQELSKSMAAERDSQKTWNVTKTSNPAVLSFGDTCLVDPAGNSQALTVEVSWTVVESPAGEVTVMTDITATNPAHRKLLVSVTDVIKGDFGGGFVELPFLTNGVSDVEIDANTSMIIYHHEETFDQSDLDGLGLSLNDLVAMMDTATATYTDFAFPDVVIPGELTAEASTGISNSGVVLNNTAVITDVENITGTGLSFSVDSFSGASGSYLGGYVEGDATTGPVGWASDPQSTSGSVTFNKTVYLDMPRNTSGKISDVATLNGSDGAFAQKSAMSDISATATSELTIYKTVDIAPDPGEEFVFNFAVSGVGIVPITILPGETSGEATISSLAQALYSVTEQATAGFDIDSQNPQSADFGNPAGPLFCALDVSFANVAQPATVRVIKVTDPTGAEAGWTFDLSGPGISESDSTDNSGIADFAGLELGEGTYTITEQGMLGWDLSQVTNPDGSNDPSECTFTVNLPEDANQLFTCTFENTQRSTIIVEKVLNGEVVDSSSFSFDTNDAEGFADFNLSATVGVAPDCGSDLQCKTFADLKPGLYTVEELTPAADFSFVSLSCSITEQGADNADSSIIVLAGAVANIGLAAGETVKCTYTNFRAANPGSIIIEKYVVGPDGTTIITDRDAEFPYSTSSSPDGVGGGVSLPANFSLTTVNGVSSTSPLFTNIFAGDHTVTESVPAGYALDRVECEEVGGTTGAPSTGAGGYADISLDDGETIICRFYNKPLPRVRVLKVLIPASDSGLFDLRVDGGVEAANVGDGGDTGWVTVNVGGHSVSELGAGGTDLNHYVSDVSCDNAASVDPGTSLNIGNLDYNDDVTCTITNTRKGNIQIVKNSIGGDGQFNYTGSLGLTQLTTSGGTADTGTTYYNLNPGTYTVSETDPTPEWDLTDLSCTDTDNTVVSNATATIELDPGETVICTYENTRRGNIIIVKNTIGGDGTFDFTGSLGLTQLTTAGGTVDTGTTYFNMIPGAYSVSETDPAPDWDLTGLSCIETGASNTSTLGATASIVLDPGETVTCTYENTKRIMIDLLKTFNGLVDPNLSVTFELYEGPDGFGGALLASSSTFGDLDGVLEFGNIKLPAGGTYSICERNIPAGTTANWWRDTTSPPDGIGDVDLSGDVYNPNADDPVPEDVGNRCVDFGVGTSITVDAGGTLHLVVDNERPEGDRRTPGYWKNWNECSNGNQAQTAAKNGGFENGFWLLEDLIPSQVDSIGDVSVTDCQTAVYILDSRSLGGKHNKMAKYADFTLARALMASKLNLAVPTSDCAPSVQPVVDAADQLLIDVGYDATTGQLRPKDSEHGYALYLAGILDDFNNNICTPYTLP